MNAVYDPATGLEWLSPRATLRTTYSDVLGGPLMQLGYRYATSSELTALIGHAGIDMLTEPANWRGRAANIEAMQTLVTAFGATYQNNPPSQGDPFGQQEVYGVLADIFTGDGQPPATASHQYALFGASANLAYFGTGGQWLFGASDPFVGSFLVRDGASAELPEPGTGALLAVALLAAMVGTRWRRGGTFRNQQARFTRPCFTRTDCALGPLLGTPPREVRL